MSVIRDCTYPMCACEVGCWSGQEEYDYLDSLEPASARRLVKDKVFQDIVQLTARIRRRNGVSYDA